MEETGECSAPVVKQIHCWTANRSSTSTGLLYSFSQRDDTEVFDEPFHAHHLQVTGLQTPWSDMALDFMDTDAAGIIAKINQPKTVKVCFYKHLSCQRLPAYSEVILQQGFHFLLISDPVHELPWISDNPNLLSYADLGYGEMLSIFSDLRSMGINPLVIDCIDLENEPEGTLRFLCNHCGIPFDMAMLSWLKGPKNCEGVWADDSYVHARQSPSFKDLRTPLMEFPGMRMLKLEEIMPSYLYLKKFARKNGDPIPIDVENGNLLVRVGCNIVPRRLAELSVYDSALHGGDAIFEILRIHKGKVCRLLDYAERLLHCANLLNFNGLPNYAELVDSIYSTFYCNENLLYGYLHVILTRGKLDCSFQFGVMAEGPKIVVIPRRRSPVVDLLGIRASTAISRRMSCNLIDTRVRHCNLLWNLLAKMECDRAGVEESIILDAEGFVSEMNSFNIFVLKGTKVTTPDASCCHPGLTRDLVMRLVPQLDLEMVEGRITLSELYLAQEVWATGRMEIVPVVQIDGRAVGDGTVGERALQLAGLLEGAAAQDED